MILDEAIRHCEEKAEHLKQGAQSSQSMTAAEQADCLECAKEHEQLAEWLKELKAYKDADITKYKDEDGAILASGGWE